MPYIPPPDLASLDITAIAELVAQRKLPPVEQWAPTSVSESHMRIDAQGRWFHKGGPITRPAMVRAFSSLLRREVGLDGGAEYSLVTPYEKQNIAVEDAPFIAVEMEVKGEGPEQQLVFRLNTDDLVIAGPDHALTFFDMDTEPRAYCEVRGGLLARLNRPAFYALVDLAMKRGEPLVVQSNGLVFPLGEGAQ